MEDQEVEDFMEKRIFRPVILNEIRIERARQEKIHPTDLDLAQQHIVLIEEVGEVAEALQKYLGIPGTKKSDKSNLRQELIEVAAVAVRMAERVMHDEHREGIY